MSSSDEHIIQVVNFALALLRGSINVDAPFLDSWDEDQYTAKASPTLRVMKICYPRALRKMQGRYPFPELERFPVPGSELDEDDWLDMPDWEYVYAMPDDCIAFWGVVSHSIDSETGEWTEYPSQVVGNQIACNCVNSSSGDPYYRFHVNIREENVGLWSEELFQMTAHQLALTACSMLGGTLENLSVVQALYDRAWLQAKAGIEGRRFRPGTRRHQTGGAVELAPGVLDYKFPLPS